MKLKDLIQQLKEFSTNCDWGEDTEIYVSNPVQGDCENVANPVVLADGNYGYLTIFPDIEPK